MTQRNVERLIGRLVTDEALRGRFIEDPMATVARLVAEGWELSVTERDALARLDRRTLAQMASRIDRNIQKASLAPQTCDTRETPGGSLPMTGGDNPPEETPS